MCIKYVLRMLTENTEDSEAYQRLNITMPNEKVDEMDKERGNIPRSTYLSGLIGQRENPRGKTVVLPKYHRYIDGIGEDSGIRGCGRDRRHHNKK